MSLYFLMFFLGIVTSSLACSCLREHPQKDFCRADFAIRARVASPPRDGSMPNSQPQWKYRVYTVWVSEIFRGDKYLKKNMNILNYTNLYTPSKNHACRVNLAQGTEYLFYGDNYLGNLYVSFCDWRKEWSMLTPEQVIGVQAEYREGCRCLIGFCLSGRCDNLWRGCHGFEQDDIIRQCRSRYQHCAVDEAKGECSWSKNDSFERCRNVIYP